MERNGSSGSSGREALIVAARRLFAEQGIDAVSLREVVRLAGQKNSNAVQYHFGDREALITAVVEPFEREIGVRRSALVDTLTSESAPSIRSIAGALVRPSAAMLESPAGREHLRIIAELIVDIPRLSVAMGTADSWLDQWDELARANMAESTFPLHRRYAATSLCFTELGRRSAAQGRSHHRLFVSDLVDLVAGVLGADVSDETQRLLEDRDDERGGKRSTTQDTDATS